MRIVVTGGLGFIGSAVIRHLLRTTEHQVLNLDKVTYAATETSVAPVITPDRYSWSRTDVADGAAVSAAFAAFDPDAVMHLAAETHVDRSIDGPAEFIQTNVVGTMSMLQAARSHWEQLPEERRQRFRFVHVSTDEVFGSLGPDDRPFDEHSPHAPRSPYSASKAASDHLAAAWFHTYGLPVSVTHCSNNYGPYQFPEKLIPLVVLRAREGQPLPVYGTGENVRDWLFVADHARALVRVVEAGVPGQTYAIGGNAERTNLEVVQTICDAMDERRPAGAPHRDLITFVEDRPGHDHRYAIDASKVRDQLGWEPQTRFDDGIRATIDWYLDNEAWWRPIVDRTYQLDRMGSGSTNGR